MYKKEFWPHWLLLALLVVFAAFKIPTLDTPYFWDELGVYVPGALKMKDNGTIGLLPSSLEPLYSRGHPLLFVFSQASWFHLIGDTPAAGHAFSVLLALSTLAVFFYCAKDLFGASVALMASLLLAVQPMFFAMAGVVLPEMMLTLFTVPAVWAIVRNRWGIFALSGSLALMTKESAIVLPPVGMLIIFADSLRARQVFSAATFRKYLFVTVPFMVYAVFLLIQKKQNGWFFFPEHMGYLRWDSSFFDQIATVFRDMFFAQGRVLIGLMVLFVVMYDNKSQKSEARAINIFSPFVLVCILFSALNFYLARYMLFALPFVVLMGTVGVRWLLERVDQRWRYAAGGCFFALCTTLHVLSMDGGKFADTSDMSYLHLVRAQKEAIVWLENQPWRDSLIEANFPMFQAIGDMRNGYLSVKPITTSKNYEKRAAYGLLFHFKEDESLVWDNRPYTVIQRWKMPYAFISAVKY